VDFLDPDSALQIRNSLTSSGFVFLRNTPIEPGIIRECMCEANRFFAKDTEFKRGSLTDDGKRGYYRYVGDSLEQDSIEAFNIGNINGTSKTRAPYYKLVGLPKDCWAGGSEHNRWPNDDVFKQIFERYYELCELTAAEIMRKLAISFELDEHHFASTHSRGDHVLELKRYPPAQTIDSAFRLAPHADLSSLTILTQDAVDGLEVADRENGVWVPVPAQEDLILVNSGDFLQACTGGILPSTLHRVVATDTAQSTDRVSIVYFFTPDWDSKVGCVLPCGSGGGGEENEPELTGDKMPF
jgi:isopenicillin N synthase-like dioxygenase